MLPPRDLAALARSFPTLANAPAEFFAPFGEHAIGFASGDDDLEDGSGGAIGFASWVREKGGGGMRDAGLFVLSVWNASDDWREIAGLSRDDGPTGGRFDVHRALGNWDNGHRAAFLAWAASPWWL